VWNPFWIWQNKTKIKHESLQFSVIRWKTHYEITFWVGIVWVVTQSDDGLVIHPQPPHIHNAISVEVFQPLLRLGTRIHPHTRMKESFLYFLLDAADDTSDSVREIQMTGAANVIDIRRDHLYALTL